MCNERLQEKKYKNLLLWSIGNKFLQVCLFNSRPFLLYGFRRCFLLFLALNIETLAIIHVFWYHRERKAYREAKRGTIFASKEGA